MKCIHWMILDQNRPTNNYSHVSVQENDIIFFEYLNFIPFCMFLQLFWGKTSKEILGTKEMHQSIRVCVPIKAIIASVVGETEFFHLLRSAFILIDHDVEILFDVC